MELPILFAIHVPHALWEVTSRMYAKVHKDIKTQRAKHAQGAKMTRSIMTVAVKVRMTQTAKNVRIAVKCIKILIEKAVVPVTKTQSAENAKHVPKGSSI